ncbi:hypothetical protein VTL71DRAFT_13337 [Oculimacula yallundae]|uniref:RBR-type E3 ubiquitin transferase n=1 Tax=Oculimacula yallundae TaxID=86028 RepID=A0ABR4CLI8_9HELO
MGLFSRKLSSKSRLSLVDQYNIAEPPLQESNRFSVSNTIQEEDSPIEESLRITIQQHEIKIQEQEFHAKDLSDIIERMKLDEEQLYAQIRTCSQQLNQAKGDVQDLRAQTTTLEEQCQNLNWQYQVASTTIRELRGACNEKDGEISDRSNSIRVLSGHNKQLQDHVAHLERIVASASQGAGTDLRSFFDRYAEMETSHRNISTRLATHEGGNMMLQEAFANLESENASLKTVIQELQNDASGLETCQPQTLRSLLTMRLVDQALIAGGNDTASRNQNWVPTGLPQQSLDTRCSPAEIQHLANLLPTGPDFVHFYKKMSLDICSVCTKPKFKLKTDPRQNFSSSKWLNEYLGNTRYFACCHEQVCKECFTKHVLKTLESGWWFRLGSLQWFSCPREGCEEGLGIRCEADLEICLERNCDTEASEHVKRYIKAMAFRQALEALEPKPDQDALTKAAELTRCLVEANRMHSLFDTRFDSVTVDETGCIPDFNPGAIYHASIDNSSSPVPLFLRFIRRQVRPKSCMVCSKSMFEIDYGDVDTWKAACNGFEGSWMWNVLVFPTSEIQQCDHDFEVCRACTAEHLRGALVSGGPSACDSLSCPQCSRVLSYQEVHRLADTQTVAKYEKFMLQTFLSKDPNFRWCLSPLCETGQLYQTPPIDPKTSCEECNYEMCFKHEMPWHDGLTCDEYDSVRDHGDPSYGETQEWIRTNTKPCPGCQVGIQKGEACFHMTCSQCNHEFCWQCLADWTGIRTNGQNGHGVGCFFRTNDIRPTGIQGNNLEEALRARAG